MYSGIFPGQGSQSIGMGKVQFDNFKVAKELFEEASDTLSINFKKLCFEGPAEDLALTENTQPALLLVSTCFDKIIKDEFNITFSALAGHSIGEYAAVVSAGSLKFPDALKAVKIRGQAMQSAVPVGLGGMSAVMGLDEKQVTTLCHWGNSYGNKSDSSKPTDHNDIVEPANFNCPGQIVISGSKKVLDWMSENASIETIFADDIGVEKPKRLKLIPLVVSAPFHCSMMKPAEDKMSIVLNEIVFQDASMPIMQNVNAKPSTAANDLRSNLIKQVTAPVKWTECFNNLINFTNTSTSTEDQVLPTFIELGNGKVLQGLAKKINKDIKVLSFNSLNDLKTIEASL